MSTTGACVRREWVTDRCNHPYKVGLVSTPYGCGSEEMNIRSDWVFYLRGCVVVGRGC